MTAPALAGLLDRLEKAREAAWDELAGLCDGSRRWTLRVPVDARDSDEVIGAALTALQVAENALRDVTELHRRDEDTDACWHCNHAWPCPTVAALSAAVDRQPT